MFLALAASDFINGMIIYVDGGILATIGKPGNEYRDRMGLKLNQLVSGLCALVLCAACASPSAPDATGGRSPWILVDDFESEDLLNYWTNIDVQNETRPRVPDPQITEIQSEPESGNRYMLRKPAADGVVGNRKAIGFLPLPVPIEVGETYTFYTRVNVEYFPNNHSFGLSNVAASDIPDLGYDSFEPMIRITDKYESSGYKNDGTLMVLVANKAYRRIVDPATGEPAQPLEPGQWYELWYVVNNAAHEAGGQRYDLYVRGGEFAAQQLVYSGAEYRMQRTMPLMFFMAISNTGPHKAPYGNGGVRYDDIYMAKGRTLSSPLD